jgi:protein involved in polysaccharide export with SLBB domain
VGSTLTFVRCALLLCVVLMAEGCSTHPGTPPGIPARNVFAAPPLPRGQYKIEPGDLLMITFAGEADYNQQVRVDWDGRIGLSYLGHGVRPEMKAAGLDVSTLAGRIAAYARENQILVNPKVQVLVAEYAGQTFVLLGQVNQPGRYAFPRGQQPHLDLLEAVALGGGYTRLARQSEILIRRGATVYKVDLRRLATESGSPRFIVVPGDVITVTERMF